MGHSNRSINEPQHRMRYSPQRNDGVLLQGRNLYGMEVYRLSLVVYGNVYLPNSFSIYY